jgi:hypothetical protein
MNRFEQRIIMKRILATLSLSVLLGACAGGSGMDGIFGGNSGGLLSIVSSFLTFCLTCSDVLLDGMLADKPSMSDADAHQLIATK